MLSPQGGLKKPLGQDGGGGQAPHLNFLFIYFFYNKRGLTPKFDVSYLFIFQTFQRFQRKYEQLGQG